MSSGYRIIPAGYSVLLLVGIANLAGCDVSSPFMGKATTVNEEKGETMLASRFDSGTLELKGQPRSLELLPSEDGFGSVWAVIASNGTIVDVPAGAGGGDGRLVWWGREGRLTTVASEVSS